MIQQHIYIVGVSKLILQVFLSRVFKFGVLLLARACVLDDPFVWPCHIFFLLSKCLWAFVNESSEENESDDFFSSLFSTHNTLSFQQSGEDFS